MESFSCMLNTPTILKQLKVTIADSFQKPFASPVSENFLLRNLLTHFIMIIMMDHYCAVRTLSARSFNINILQLNEKRRNTLSLSATDKLIAWNTR